MSTIAAQSSTNPGKEKMGKGKVKVVKGEVKGNVKASKVQGKGKVNDKVGKVSEKGKGQVCDKVGEVSGKGKRKSSEVKGKDIISPPLYDDISVVREAFSDESLMKKLFQDWKRDYDRSYDTEEEELKRYECFKDSAHLISNDRHEGIDYTGLNVFADIPWDEFKVQKCGGFELYSDPETHACVGSPPIFLTPA